VTEEDRGRQVEKSGFVVFVESENVGTVSFRRLASGASLRRVRAFSLASDGCRISGGVTYPVQVPVSSGGEVRGVDDAVLAVAESIAPMRSRAASSWIGVLRDVPIVADRAPLFERCRP